jgi:small subunit ribosomal protein S20
MANTAQARKRARQAVKQRAHNAGLRSTLRTAIKKIIKAIEDGDKAAATATYRENVSVIDSIADKGIIHKNKAARHKSRLNQAIKSMDGSAPKAAPAKKAAAPKAAPKAKATGKADKLTLIEGIGPKISELLTTDGIVTFADLADAQVEKLSEILAAAGSRYTMHKPDTWPQQAALARDGKMDELKELQDRLDGGKE